jgi:hypothetical protein
MVDIKQFSPNVVEQRVASTKAVSSFIPQRGVRCPPHTPTEPKTQASALPCWYKIVFTQRSGTTCCVNKSRNESIYIYIYICFHSPTEPKTQASALQLSGIMQTHFREAPPAMWNMLSTVIVSIHAKRVLACHSHALSCGLARRNVNRPSDGERRFAYCALLRFLAHWLAALSRLAAVSGINSLKGGDTVIHRIKR